MNKSLLILVNFLLLSSSALLADNLGVHADNGRGSIVDVFIGDADAGVSAIGGGGGSNVEVNDNLMVNQVTDSHIVNSTVGLAVNAVDSTVAVNDNTNINTIENSDIEDSIIGVGVNAMNGSSVTMENNINVNQVTNSRVSGSAIGTIINAR